MKRKKYFWDKKEADEYFYYFTVCGGKVIDQYHTRKQAEASDEYQSGVTIMTRKQYNKEGN